MPQDVFSWSEVGDCDGPRRALLCEEVGAPWWRLGGVVGHLIELDPGSSRVAFESGTVATTVGKVVHHGAGVRRTPLIPLQLAVRI